jgi:hypothetical protein
MDGCEKPKLCFGLCAMHYQRQYRHGDPGIVKPPNSGNPPRTLKLAQDLGTLDLRPCRRFLLRSLETGEYAVILVGDPIRP